MSSRLEPVFDHSAQANVSRMPPWIRLRLHAAQSYAATAHAVRAQRLHTVCEEARCPNRNECWSRGTATFMLLGDVCTRACGFCAVQTGKPPFYDTHEAQRVAAAVAEMGLSYVVLTSVNRDDLSDGGAHVFAQTITALRQRQPDIGIELLTPDFKSCQEEAITCIASTVADDYPLVWGHNVETVPRLYRHVRKGSVYACSLRLLERASQRSPIQTKSALMLGLGETPAEVSAVLRDLRLQGVTRLALGQYLRPTRAHLPVREYIAPQRFADYAQEARELGFTWIKAGPLVRSSYHAEG